MKQAIRLEQRGNVRWGREKKNEIKIREEGWGVVVVGGVGAAELMDNVLCTYNVHFVSLKCKSLV